MNFYLACSAALVLLYAVLSVTVSLTRLRRRKDPSITDARLTKVVRAHGNAAEYIPIFVLMFLYANSLPPSAAMQWIAGAAVVSRYFHAIGIYLIPDMTHRHPLRFLGALGTYVCLFAFGFALLARAIPG
jgi:hypothetical protein